MRVLQFIKTSRYCREKRLWGYLGRRRRGARRVPCTRSLIPKGRQSWIVRLAVTKPSRLYSNAKRYFMTLTLSLDHNPYGTPTSLSLTSPQDRVLENEINISVIPDSPACRGSRSIWEASETAADYHRESTKSESPELDSPIHDIAHVDPASPTVEQLDDGIYEIQPGVPPELPSRRVQTDHQSRSAALPMAVVDAESTTKPTRIQHSMGTSSTMDDASERQQTENVPNTSEKSSKRKTPPKDRTLGEQDTNGIKGDIYDPIESDSESFQEKQRMHSTKRLKIGKSIRGRLISSGVPPNVNKGRKDDEFVVPSLPASRVNRGRVPSGFNAKAGDSTASIQDNVQVLVSNQPSSVTTAEESEASENLSISGKVAGQKNTLVGRVAAEINDRSTTTSDPHPSSTEEAGRLAAKDSAVAEKRRQARPETGSSELGDTMRNTDVAKGMQATEQKGMEERVTRERETKEKALAEEARKLMLAADGAKHLEAEKIEKKRQNGKLINEVAAPTGTSPKASSDAETKSNERHDLPLDTNKSTSGELVGKDTGSKTPHPTESESHNVPGSNEAGLIAHKSNRYKPRTEEQKARRIDMANQKNATEAKAAGKSNAREATTMREQDMPTLERSIQNFRGLSVDRSCHSSTSSEPASIGNQRRKTMTPALPRSSVSTPSSTKDGILSSSPLVPRSLNCQETPLRSSLKQGSSALRRSVSFVDDPDDRLSGSKAAIFLSPPMTQETNVGSRPVKTLTDINNELSFKTPTGSKTFKPAMPLRGTNSKASETNPSRKGKLQTKLNVTRHVAKGKGRESDAPFVRELPASQGKQISSPSDDDAVSSFSEEAVGPNGSSKAGPSSRKSRRRMESLRERAAPVEVLPDSLIDPEFRNITTSKAKVSIPAPASTSLPEQKSSTRSPALPLPERTSPDFSMTSNSEYGPSAESNNTSGSSAGASDSSSLAEEVKCQISNLSRDFVKGARKAVSVEIRSPSITSRGQTSQIPSIMSSKSRNVASNDDNSRLVDQAAKEQLRCELNQSLPTPKSGERATGEVPAQGKPASKPDQKIDRHGRLPNGIRPANYRYPSLSQLRRQSKADSIFNIPSVSKASPPTSVEESMAAGHSSEDESSEDESSESEEDENVNKGQPKIKSTSGSTSGLKGLIKRM